MKKIFTLCVAALMAGMTVMAQEVCPPAGVQIEKYAATGYSYATYENESWTALVAIDGTDIYVKDMMPNMEDTQWVKGTIASNAITFVGGQPLGVQDQTKFGGELYFDDCALYGVNTDFEFIDAHFSWDAASKTIKATDYEVASCVIFEGELAVNDALDGWSDPDATLTLVGTGEYENPTAIETVASKEAKATKWMENGQFYCVRAGVKYNAAGMVIK